MLSARTARQRSFVNQLFEELKRRNVFRVAIAYLAVAWLIIQVADVVFDNISRFCLPGPTK
jgi:hypothetical protein